MMRPEFARSSISLSTIVVNPMTTAVVLLEHEDPAIGFSDLIGKISGAPAYQAVTAFAAHSAASVTARAIEVSELLAANVDPLGRQQISPGNLAPDGMGDPSARGGGWHDVGPAGMWLLYLYRSRSFVAPYCGFRPALRY